MRKITLLLMLWILSFCLCGCTETAKNEFFAMDTVITMEVTGKDPQAALALAEDEILRLEQLLSVSGAQSDIAGLNAGEAVQLSPDTALLLEQALAVSEATGGAYDCTIQPAVDAWGWYSDSPAVPEEAQLRAALELVDYRCISLDGGTVSFSMPGMGIDLGGIGKGYAAGRTAALLRECGVESGWISLGGNVRTIGEKPDGSPWVIGIADPDNPAGYKCTVSVKDAAVVTSGDYQRRFTQDGNTWHHILDPETGYPTDNGLRSVTIVCQDDALADGLSTALFVMGPEKAADFWRSGVCDFEAVFLTDTQVYVTQGLADGFSCQTAYEVISH